MLARHSTDRIDYEGVLCLVLLSRVLVATVLPVSTSEPLLLFGLFLFGRDHSDVCCVDRPTGRILIPLVSVHIWCDVCCVNGPCLSSRNIVLSLESSGRTWMHVSRSRL